MQDPVRVTLREGHVVDIQGGLDAKLMADWLAEGKTSATDQDPYAVSHLGWGMNPQARWNWLGLTGGLHRDPGWQGRHRRRSNR